MKILIQKSNSLIENRSKNLKSKFKKVEQILFLS